MSNIYCSDKRYLLIIILLSVLLSACGGPSPSSDLRGKHKRQSDFVVGSEQTSDQSFVTLKGRAVKGIVQYGQVLVYAIQSGRPGNEPFGVGMTEETGEFLINLPHLNASQLTLLEISSVSHPPSSMLCDAYSGCGLRDGVTIYYGDHFPLSPGTLMRSISMLKGGSNALIGNFSPVRHAAVARTEAKAEGMTWSNMKEAESELAELFLFSKPIRELAPINLLSVAETEGASDEQVVLAILEASFLNIGVSPNYVPVEEVLTQVTVLRGQFEPHVHGDYYRLSLHNLLRAAYHNIPDYVAHRPGIKAHLIAVIEERAPELGAELNISPPEDKTASVFSLQVFSSDGGSLNILPLDEQCSNNCEHWFAEGESVSFIPVPDEGYEFSYWEADCDGATESCDLLMDDQKIAAAVFRLSDPGVTSYSLTLNVSGGGLVVEQNTSSLCVGEVCNALLEQGQQVMLVPSAKGGYQFDGWSGDCSGTGSCGLSMDGNKVMTAHFSPILVQLTLELSGAGGVSSTSGLNCSSSPCQFSLPLGEAVSLVANPSSGFQFDSWGGDCSGKSACAGTMNSNKRVVANFSPIMHQVTLTSSVGGLIANGDQSLECSEPTCVFNFAEGSFLDLRTLAKNGYQFESWAGACSGTGACSLEIKQDMAVYANFSPILHTLTVSVPDGGTVTSLAADLNCFESVCSALVQEGKKITLSALSSDGYEFGSWSGQCVGSSADCPIVVESDVALSVSFNPAPIPDGSISVTWAAPLEREDGSPLSSTDIQSYTIYYSQTSGIYSDAITVAKMDGGWVPTSATLRSLEKGSTYYIAGITVDTNGVPSQLSNEIVKTAN